MQKIVKSLRVLKYAITGKKYQPLNSIEISAQNILKNYKYISNISKNISIAPVLKSNAYGHGLIQIAEILDKSNCPFFCVDSIYEAYELLKNGVKTKILIMGYVDPKNLSSKKLPFAYTVWDQETVKKIAKYQPGSSIHIFVDTGMNREGVAIKCEVKKPACRQAGEKCKAGENNCLLHFLSKIKNLPGIQIEGLMSHLASSTKNTYYPKLQVKNFQKALKICRELDLDPKWKHLAASGGLINGFSDGTNLSRVGRAIYGIDPPGDTKGKLKPALTLKTKIVQIKKVKKGSKIGYDGAYIAKRDMTLGILPIGYNDGADRRLSSLGVVKIGKDFCQIIGRISMNVTTCDLTKITTPVLGQEVIFYSGICSDPNSPEAAAKLCATLPHDILVHLTPSIRREVRTSNL